MRIAIVTRAAILPLALIAGLAPARARDPVVVATSLQPLFSITSALARETAIEVRAAPAALPGMQQLARAFTRQAAAIGGELERADAVVSIASVWPEDPLFREARARNIRVVHIDAARSLARGAASITLIARPVSNVPWRGAKAGQGDSPWAWFSPSNAIRMAEIIAADIKRLAPEDEARIEANLVAFTREIQALRAEYDAKFLTLDNPAIFALTDHFVYLTNEFGLFIEGYLVEDDVLWSPADFDGLAQFIEERGVRQVLHHWQPAEPVAAAITKAGASLLVLDDGENSNGAPAAKPDARLYQTILRADLEALFRALGGGARRP